MTTTETQNRRNAMKTTTRIRRAIAALALATAVAAPATLAATASPAGASTRCPPEACTVNHNEDGAPDDEQ